MAGCIATSHLQTEEQVRYESTSSKVVLFLQGEN